MKKRILVLLSVVALMVGVFATAAYAATIFCTTDLCIGTANKDTIYDDPGATEIRAKAGNDVVRGDYYWYDDEDLLLGQRGNDLLDAADFDTGDVVNGGGGTDVCLIDRNTETKDTDSTSNCETVRVSTWDPDDIE